jgi:thiamine biosynthesis lipoprotein
LLGTLVSMQVVAGDAGEDHAREAVADAFAAMEMIHHAMSAHSPHSDLAKLARASAGSPVTVSPHTCAVLRAARHWTLASAHAFDPHRAALQLAQRGLRPGVANGAAACGSLAGLQFVNETTLIPDGPLALDLGGIAKGYAVDRAVDILRARGVRAALVNAGGDLRAFGDRPWPIDIRHPEAAPLRQRLQRLKEGAVATSVNGDEFVPKHRAPSRWRCACVQARDCMTADALTKWALQAGEPGLRLRRTARQHGARLLRW